MNLINRRHGFTLVEVLVASSILAIIGTLIFGTFSATLASGVGVRERADTTHVVRFIVKKLTEDLQSASLLPNNKLGVFTGSDSQSAERQTDEMRFTGFGRRVILLNTGSEQALIRWFVKKPKDPEALYTLYRSENPDIASLEDGGKMEEVFDVTDQLIFWNVRYYYNRKFLDSFDSKSHSALPHAVEVTFALENMNGERVNGSALVQVGGRT